MDRQFTPGQARDIFAAAAEMQRRSTSGGEDGLTLGELEAAARSAGLDPAFVRRAVAEMDDPTSGNATKRMLGIDVERRRTAFFPERLDESDWPRIVRELRQVTGERGVSSEMGSEVFEWSSHTDRQQMPFHVTADVEEHGTAVRVEHEKIAQYRSILVGTSAPFILFGIILTFLETLAPGSEFGPAPLGLIAIGIFAFILSYASMHYGAKRDRKRIDEIMEVLQGALGEPPTRSAARWKGHVSAPGTSAGFSPDDGDVRVEGEGRNEGSVRVEGLLEEEASDDEEPAANVTSARRRSRS